MATPTYKLVTVAFWKGSRPLPEIDRASPIDYLMCVMDVGPIPLQVGAVVRFASGPAVALEDLRQRVAERARATPKLRQRLVKSPLGCGWPVWVDDPGFDIAAHVQQMSCPAPRDDRALMSLASRLVTARLPPERPLWLIMLVTELVDESSALVAVLHHCLADGLGGVAVLRNLADGAPALATELQEFPRRRPAAGALFLNAVTMKLEAARHPERLIRSLRGAWRDVVNHELPRSPRSSLIRAGGQRRELVIARAQLRQVRAAASAAGGRPDDIVLCAAAGALGRVAAARGEKVTHVVAGLSVSFRTKSAAAKLGNDVGTITISVPCSGDGAARLMATAAATRGHRAARARGSVATWAPVFAAMRALGLLRFFVQHQRFVTTFVSYVPGPKRRLTVLGAPVTDVAPFSSAPGNTAVTFTALSYNGWVTVTASCDPALAASGSLADALQKELDSLVAAL